MKQPISPAVAAVIVVVVLGAAALLWMRAGGVENRVGEKPPGMPPDVAAKWNEITNNKGPGQGGNTIPSITGGAPGGQPGGAPGGMTGPGGSTIPTGPGTAPMPTGPPTGR